MQTPFFLIPDAWCDFHIKCCKSSMQVHFGARLHLFNFTVQKQRLLMLHGICSSSRSQNVTCGQPVVAHKQSTVSLGVKKEKKQKKMVYHNSFVLLSVMTNDVILQNLEILIKIELFKKLQLKTYLTERCLSKQMMVKTERQVYLMIPTDCGFPFIFFPS